ncbi:Ig-like domain-containing protein [uncultured Intestinibacter sp.]|jgi:hypothetical protein|uniref:Ig-like domain-containing protein n=1 Tax=uncultured Intestinibacter sp. TaxID=1505659 RepID=UPI0027DD66CF|nr:Ig-like domain-containing protein [uncultured Intestinibacter sp.]
MIYKQSILTINGNNAKLDEDIYLFRLDKNIELYFTIVNNKYKFNKSDLNNIINLTNASYFQMRLYKNAEVKYTFAIQPTDNGKAILTITDDLIDEPIEVGDYDFQISLLDADKSSMISLPIVSKQIHVCEPLVTDASETGTAVLGLSTLESGEIVDAFDEEGNYIRKVHVNGELISAELFNKWEEALETNSSNIKTLDSQFKDIANYSLAVGNDGLLYLSDGKGTLLGNGIDIKKMQEVVSNLVSVFTADFSGDTPLANQFYSWENRIYGSAIYDALSNIQCIDNVAHLTSVYDSENLRWKKQMMCTGGLFESDNFTCEFEAKFDGKAGSWNNVITYGTGTHWTNGVYSDGVKWPAGGEIDAFEQAGGYSNNPNYFYTPTVHYGSGTGSGYPDTHEVSKNFNENTIFTLNEWHKFKFSLQNGYVKIYIDDELKQEGDFSGCIVNNNYLCDYKPFLKPQAFYIDGSCADNSNTSNVYDFAIKNFKIYQDANVECTNLEIYPQMWEKGTELVFPTGVEFFLDKIFTPSNTSNKACKWESSNPNVAMVCEGYVKTLTEGTTTIKATCGNVSAIYILTVNNTNTNIPCTKIKLAKNNLIVKSGKTIDFSYYVYPKFSTNQVNIISVDANIATVSNTKITGISEGNTRVLLSCGEESEILNVSVEADKRQPYVEYDFTEANNKIGMSENAEGFSTTGVIENTGSDGEFLNLNLTYGTSVINSDTGEKGISYYNGQSKTLSDAKDLQSYSHLMLLKGVNTFNNTFSLTLNGDNSNIMPSVTSSQNDACIKYGSANVYTFPLDTDKTTTHDIAIYHDASKASVFIDGKKVVSDGKINYITTALSYFITRGKHSYFACYHNCEFSDEELIAMTSGE